MICCDCSKNSTFEREWGRRCAVRHCVQILHEAWAPLGQGNKKLLELPTLIEIARYHKKTVGQIILRWHIERGIIVIPKSSNPKRIKDNIDISDFKLSDDEMQRIHRLETGTRYSVSPTGYMVISLYVKLMKLFV